MDDTYQVSDSVQSGNTGTENVQTLTTSTVAAPKARHERSKDLSSAVTVTGISMIAIFVFMFIFYLVIKAIDHLFPDKSKL